MKKRKKQNITIAVIVAVLIIGIVSYNYSADQTRQKGFQFGNELQSIQDDLKSAQTMFYSNVKMLEEKDMTKEEFLEFSNLHLTKLEGLLLRYDELEPPKSFAPAVELFRLSTESQLESDKEYIAWIDTEDDSHRIRSDEMFKESVEYENAALAKYNQAKAGINP